MFSLWVFAPVKRLAGRSCAARTTGVTTLKSLGAYYETVKIKGLHKILCHYTVTRDHCDITIAAKLVKVVKC